MLNRRLLLALAIAFGGCSHEQPFETPDTGTDQPFLPGNPLRLTYNSGKDLRPAWSADGSSIYYAWQRLGGTDPDRCIGELPGTGGQSLRTICPVNPAAADSADLFDTPAPGPGGQLLYTRGASRPGAVAPDHNGIFVGPDADPLSASQVRSLPFTIPGVPRTVGTIGYARWVAPSRLLVLAQSVDYPRACSNCPPDTLVTGLVVAELDAGTVPAVATPIALTTGATSLDLNAAQDTIYYTLRDDSRVYRLARATGQSSVAHDFGALGIARDVAIRGGTLVAVVGGAVNAVDDPIFGPIQPDSGGPLISVDLATGTETALPATPMLYYRRPAFAAGSGGSRLIVEGYPISIDPLGVVTVSAVSDLYLFVSP